MSTLADYTVDEDGNATIHANAWSRVMCPHCGHEGRAHRMKYHVSRCSLIMRDKLYGQQISMTELDLFLAPTNKKASMIGVRTERIRMSGENCLNRRLKVCSKELDMQKIEASYLKKHGSWVAKWPRTKGYAATRINPSFYGKAVIKA